MPDRVVDRLAFARGRRVFLRDLARLTALGGVAVLAGCQSAVPTAAPTAAAKALPPTTAPPAATTAPAATSAPTAATAATVAPAATKPAASPAAAGTPAPAGTAPAGSPAATQPAAGSPAAAASPGPCQFQLGFAAMRDLVGASTVGTCLENERLVPGNGNTEQRTSNGVMVLRAIDRRVLFVGATQTWINRDGTVVTRPNDQRLEWEGDRQLVEALRKGGQVVYVRHGATDPSQRDTEPTNLANCATQRNLTDAGRQQARAIGEALKTLEIPVGQVLSSEYCRAREFSRLIFGKDAEVEPSLVLPDPLTEQQRAENTEALKRVLAKAPAAGTNTFLVSHSPNIKLAAGIDMPAEGSASILRLEATAPTLQARVLAEEWSTWARALARR